MTVVARKAFSVLDGTLLSIDRFATTSGRDRPYHSGRHKRHGDPGGRLVWASAALPVARHDQSAARDHGLLDALTAAGVEVIADNGCAGHRNTAPEGTEMDGPRCSRSSPCSAPRRCRTGWAGGRW